MMYPDTSRPPRRHRHRAPLGPSLLAWAFACAAPAATLEVHPGIAVEATTVRTADGLRLNAIVTKPMAARDRLPAILFVQWLSCSSVALPERGGDGWEEMMRRLVRESGAVVWRTDKRGVGGSEGVCATLDYNTELADHRAALAALRQRADVDPQKIVIFGASMGSNYAPLLAAGEELAGVLVWGGGALTWAERMLAFERNALELRADPPSDLGAQMTLRQRFFQRYLIEGQSPSQIAAQDPQLGAVWSRLVGTRADAHYGRPFAFHQQAQRQDWAQAWSRVDAPVLVLNGEYDWFEDPKGAQTIARIVNARRPGGARAVQIAGLDHHFSRFVSAEAAFRDEGGVVAPNAAVSEMLQWLDQRWQARP